jgi:1,2-diacylglycerol 3-beta-galactosyltransferase
VPPVLTPDTPSKRLLFLVADTGGGHRSAAAAVTAALELRFPGVFVTIACDPLAGPDASRFVRWVTRLYGPLIRRTPRLWGAVFRLSDSATAMRLLHRTVFAKATRPVVAAILRYQPAAIVSFHPLATSVAVEGRRQTGVNTPVVTVVTDMVTAHRAWLEPGVDRILVPSAALRWRCRFEGLPSGHCVETGLPVSPQLVDRRLSVAGRSALRRSLGVEPGRFLVLVAGGAEGSGRMAAQVGAIVDRFDDISVVAVCGRNEPTRRRLSRMARHANGRLTVKGYVDNLSDWMRSADLLATKAGPGTIAEATCCGTPLLVTSFLPGQEAGNAELVVSAGAGRYAPTPERLVRDIDELRHDPGALEAMSAAAVRLSRPRAAESVAAVLAGLVGTKATDGRHEQARHRFDAVTMGGR